MSHLPSNARKRCSKYATQRAPRRHDDDRNAARFVFEAARSAGRGGRRSCFRRGLRCSGLLHLRRSWRCQPRWQRLHRVGEERRVCVDAKLIHVAGAQALLPEALLLHLLVSESKKASSDAARVSWRVHGARSAAVNSNGAAHRLDLTAGGGATGALASLCRASEPLFIALCRISRTPESD